MPMLRTIKITVTAVSMVNPCAVPRSKSAAPCTVKQDVHPATLALMVGASCFNSGLTGWSILLSHENITLVSSTRFFFYAYGARARFHRETYFAAARPQGA